MQTGRIFPRLVVLSAIAAFSHFSTLTALAQKAKPKSGTNRVTELYNAGVKLQNEGQLDEAIAKYTEAINLSPQEFQSLANRAQIYRTKGIDARENVGSNDPALKAEAAAKADEQFALAVADYDAA